MRKVDLSSYGKLRHSTNATVQQNPVAKGLFVGKMFRLILVTLGRKDEKNQSVSTQMIFLQNHGNDVMGFQSIHNYYEQHVVDHLVEQIAPELDITDENMLADIACLALNNLPPRYIRHTVDMAFFLTTFERERMRDMVTTETRKAAEKLLAGDERKE